MQFHLVRQQRALFTCISTMEARSRRVRGHQQSGILVHAPAVAKGDSLANERAADRLIREGRHESAEMLTEQREERDVYGAVRAYVGTQNTSIRLHGLAFPVFIPFDVFNMIVKFFCEI